ncbi:lysozyme inhibitor LprI family protein [Vibrio gigantis]|uniref:lysozyme inhibitor LprI family protein n=1 Tax=Vibrio gigantis TaxID=296199 RepID=UPI001BFD8FF8|nr:lysozyme inhibitor LprI family protein [Vibrio gigantis]
MKKLLSIVLLTFMPLLASASDDVVDCENAMNTLEINHCAALELESAQLELEKYLAASFEHNSYDAELVSSIKSAQESWQAYMTAHCDSVYTQWRDGSIRGLMALSCKTKLTKQRTHEVWENFLTYMDSTPPVLPEPKLVD